MGESLELREALELASRTELQELLLELAEAHAPARRR